MILRFIILLILSLGYCIYTGQIQLIFSVLGFYAAGRLLLVPIKTADLGCWKVKLFDIFFFVYGMLVLLSHIELIHNPYLDYFVHNDAAWSFFTWTMNDSFDVQLDNLLVAELKAPGSMSYFLAQVLFSKLAKLAIWLGIEDTRLFLRMHVFALAALIPPMMASIMSIYRVEKRSIIKGVILFSFGTYLFITSAIFSRDLHVCLLYTVAAYILLLPSCSCRSLIFVFLMAITYGMRQENGILLGIFLAANYYVYLDKKNLRGMILIIGAIGAVIFSAVFMSLIGDTLYSYDQASKNGNSASGLFMRFYTLPFPLNTIAMTIYMIMMPLPIGFYIVGEGNTWLTLPFVLSPYIMSALFVGALWYIRKGYNIDKRIWVTACVCMLSVFAITLGSPDLRRAYASVPGLFMAYMIVKDRIPQCVNKMIKTRIYPAIFIIVSVLSLYVYFA